MRIRAGLLASLALMALTEASAPTRRRPFPLCAQVAPREAEILIYLLPVGEHLRQKGSDLGWERAPQAEKDRNVYVYWVYDAKSKLPSAGSVTIGYYAVDRCTAAVTEEEGGSAVSSVTLRAVQRILTGQ
jgi:hypothetical protein